MIIKSPDEQYKSIEEVLDAGLKAEKEVTASINKIFETANKTNDYASKSFLKWFIDEQVEEEENAQKMIDEYSLFKNNLFELDQKYLQRKHERIEL